MKIRYYILLITMLAVSGCAVWKKSLSANGDIYVAINNCIIDFINTSNLFKADSIFAIDIIENEDIYVIGIGGAVNKIYPHIRDTIGAKNDLFPNKYIIREGKLFYWNDSKQEITQEIIDVLSRYDEIDLELGVVKLRKKGGAGTHNGMKSVIEYLKTGDFIHIRIGTGKPEFKELLIQHVIGKLNDEEYEKLIPSINKAAESIPEILKNGIDIAMNKFN